MTFRELYFSFDGRITRRDMWLKWALPSLALTVVFLWLASRFDWGVVVLVGWCVIGAIPGLAMEVKRWHDRDKSALWVLISLIPVIGPLWAFGELMLNPGTIGPNEYGPDPLGDPNEVLAVDHHDDGILDDDDIASA